VSDWRKFSNEQWIHLAHAIEPLPSRRLVPTPRVKAQVAFFLFLAPLGCATVFLGAPIPDGCSSSAVVVKKETDMNTKTLASAFVVAAVAQGSNADNRILRLPAAGAAVNVPNQAIQSLPSTTREFTVEFWARLDGTSAGRIFNKRGCSCSGLTLHVAQQSGTGWGIVPEFGDVYGGTFNMISLPIGEWHHCAMVWSAASGKVDAYRDGVLVSSIHAPGNTPALCGTEPLRFGEQCGWGIVGSLDNIRYWSVARSAAQISANLGVQFTSSQAAQQVGLIGSWTFEDGTALDGSGNNGTGTLESGATVVIDNSVPLNPPTCPGDIDDSGFVDGVDLAIILTNWGISNPKYPKADIDADGEVNASDLATVLSGWGACP
jgi:hypothetical protein